MTISFTVYGEPVAQGRPRAGRRPNGQIVVYDPGKSKDYKKHVGMMASNHKQIINMTELIDTPVMLTVKIFRPIPKKFNKLQRAQALAGYLRPASKPDLSNYIKGVEDALEGILLANDSQVVEYLNCGKWYSDSPRIEIVISEV